MRATACRRSSGSSSPCRTVVRIFIGSPRRGGFPRLRDAPPEPRGQDAELLPVLRDRAPRDPQAPLVEQLRDALVRERLLLVLLLDQPLDDVLRGARRDVLAVLGLEPARKEELELEHPARRLH